jgi:hypothetical protein
MLAVKRPAGAAESFAIPGKKNDRLEVGLVRVGTENSRQCEYIFSVYESTREGERKLFEASEKFPVDSWKLFRTGERVEGRDDGFMEIIYVLKPKRIRDRIASLVARIRGKPYSKDFAFIEPNVIRERKHDEFNVILISFDTLRADHLGCYGYERETSPNIDAFAGVNPILS